MHFSFSYGTLMLLILISVWVPKLVVGFDFFDFFKTNERQQQRQYHQHADTSNDENQESDPNQGCKYYTCPLPSRTCVDEPSQCPCPENQKKCTLNDWYICIHPDDDCFTTIQKLNPKFDTPNAHIKEEL